MDGAWRRPTDSSLRSGTPSQSEVPSGGARALLVTFGWAGIPGSFPKVTRCKSGTISSRYLNNGYVHGLIQDSGRLSGRLREQARSHIWIAGCPVDGCRLSGRNRRQASSHRLIVGCQVDERRLAGRHRRQASSHIGTERRLPSCQPHHTSRAICSAILPLNHRSAGSLSCTPLHTIDSSAASIANGGSSARRRVPSVNAHAA